MWIKRFGAQWDCILINGFNSCLFAVSEVKCEDDGMGGSETAEDWDELYACEFCDQAFTNSNDLLEHQDAHPESHWSETYG